jgi:uncharacterized membrane protein YdjX (TVP38/TMEM64 family)
MLPFTSPLPGANPAVRTPALRIVAGLLLIAAIVATITLVRVGDYATDALDWIRGLGFWGPALLVVAYVVACLLFIPGLLLSIGAGFVFGVPLGTATVSVGSTLGAALAFLVGRTLFRDSISQMIATNPKFAALDRAVGREGFKIVLLARLSPVLPFNLLNYAFGLTPVALRNYVLASWIGMLPGTIAYVYVGSTLASLADLGASGASGGPAQRALYVLGLAATIAVVVFLTRLAAKAWRDTVDDAPNSPIDAPKSQDSTDRSTP